MPPFDRHIAMDSIYNMRDLGGLPTADGGWTRPGILYRSDALTTPTPADIKRLQGMGIRHIYDLRQGYELRSEGHDQVPPEMTVHYYPTSIMNRSLLWRAWFRSPTFSLQAMYIETFGARLPFHVALFREIVTPTHQPLILHCTAGKDRTGIMVALLLRLAGVADDHIVADYAESQGNLAPIQGNHYAKLRRLRLSHRTVMELLSSEGTTMQNLLTHLDATYGSAANYLMAGGVSQDEIESFLKRFVQLDAP